jgi:hypothetical protein
MKNYQQNMNQFNGIMVKSSDMSFDFKLEITAKLKNLIDKTAGDPESIHKISQGLTKYL